MGIQKLIFCLVLCLALGRISGKVLESLEDLKEQTDFGKQNPRQGLELLCWLLNQAEVDQNGNLRLNVNPAEGHFSFHQYKNYEDKKTQKRVFPDLSNSKFLYFSLGSLGYYNACNELPEYFKKIFQNSQKHPQRNLNRIVIRVCKDDPRLVDEVFITQHFEDRNQGYNPDINVKVHTTSNSPAKSDNLSPKLSPTLDGKAKIEWDWTPKEMMERKMKICIYQHKDATKPLFEFPIDEMWCGEKDTDLPFNADLEIRLEPTTNFDTFTNREKDHPAPNFFSLSYLSSLVFYPFSSLYLLLISIIVIVVVGIVSHALTESRAEPDFVRVSHGRPGL
ncbi:hypothetical protein Baya_9812 [Bagarius yarrelli]|uniref:Phosphatidylinositol-glycan biosynthesis class X protein n=1 Tax=Bagarius yarrelli TaxID=175774 RepID=A0A556U8D5_BAGYA|nr:hypothetical protein Baya_9812 [Bagarius yarrelli]